MHTPDRMHPGELGRMNHPLDTVAHRPWPLPSGPWVLRQTWHDLLFAHWPVDAALVTPALPPGLELDRFDGVAWIGIVPFRMSDVAPRGVPALPWISAFPELNVRTYVRAGDKPGVLFFSLDAARALAVGLARRFLYLPYYTASMEVRERDGTFAYRSRRVTRGAPPAELVITYRADGPVFGAREGTLEYFLTERYCLYTSDPRGSLRIIEIQHPPWPLQPAVADLAVNTMAAAAGLALPATPPLLHFAKRQPVVTWAMRRVRRT